MRSSPVMRSEPKTGPCSPRSSPPASSTTSTRPPTSPKHSRRSSTAIPIAASKTSCRGDSAKRQASLNRVAAKRLPYRCMPITRPSLREGVNRRKKRKEISSVRGECSHPCRDFRWALSSQGVRELLGQAIHAARPASHGSNVGGGPSQNASDHAASKKSEQVAPTVTGKGDDWKVRLRVLCEQT